jgi:hypothetical protein
MSRTMLAVAVVALAGAMYAQCPGGSCGGGSSSSSTSGCPTGGCGGCGGGAKAERVDKPAGKKPTTSSPTAVVDAPEWQRPGSDVLEKAAEEKMALLIFFPGEAEEKAGEGYLAGKEIKDLSQKAQFVKVSYNAEREATPGWEPWFRPRRSCRTIPRAITA